ncbi:MAG: response regulator [Acidobacteriota bacterium]
MNFLIVEDSESMRAFISGAIESGFDAAVTETTNGFEALRALAGKQFDAIVTDINMPDINGLELLRYVREHPVYRRIPVVIISTEIAEEDRRRGMKAGASAYLNKPFRPEQLQEVLTGLLDQETV